MWFTAPFWLIGLAPWALAAIWLMRRRLPRASVPFLELWQVPHPEITPKPRLSPPPLPIALILLALLLLVLGMAGPAVPRHGHEALEAQPPLTVIVDRGISMSAREGGIPRYVATARQAADALAGAFGRHREIDLLLVPAHAALPTDLAHWTEDLAGVPPTALQTQSLLAGAVARRLERGGGPVVVLSDQPLALRDRRVIQIPPDEPLHNVGIIHLAARDVPHPQVMLRLRNQSPQHEASVRIESDGRSKTVRVALPPAGQSVDQFVDFPSLGRTVSASLQSPDALAADDAAWLVRRPSRPVVESASILPTALQRMVAVYNQLHGEDRPDTPRVVVVSDAQQLPADRAAVLLGGAGAVTLAADPALSIRPGALSAHVHWKEVLSSAEVSPAPGAGWTAVVSADGHPVLAVREKPARGVWVGFGSGRFARTPDYVIFWKNVFDHLGGDGGGYESQPVGQLGASWRLWNESAGSSASRQALDQPAAPEAGLWPGLYRREDGALRAVNAPDFIVPPPLRTAWRQQLSRQPPARAGAIGLARWCELAALVLMVAAAASWPVRRT